MKKKEEQMSLAGTEEGEILARLNERVERAIVTIQELRRERDALKAKLEEHNETSADEMDRLKRERGEIRDRIESILANLESLEENASG